MYDVTHILSAIEQGDPTVAKRLLPLVNDELPTLISHKMAQEKVLTDPVRLGRRSAPGVVTHLICYWPNPEGRENRIVLGMGGKNESLWRHSWQSFSYSAALRGRGNLRVAEGMIKAADQPEDNTETDQRE